MRISLTLNLNFKY